LGSAVLTNAKLAGAVVTGANFASAQGFTRDQLYSTASYEAKNLQGVSLNDNDLSGWDFNGLNLASAGFHSAILTGANLSGAIVTRAQFGSTTSRGFSRDQLYSTASYDAKNLQGIGLSGNNLSGWDFVGQDLTGADFNHSTLTDANFKGAIVTGARFGNTTSRGFTRDQLYSTASYHAQNLEGIDLDGNDLSGWDFNGQNLANANLDGTTLTGANLSGAIVTGARLGGATFTREQLYSTASYQAKNSHRMGLSYNDFSGWDFRGQDLTDSDLQGANLTGANLTGADTRGADNITNDVFATAITANFVFPNGVIRGLVIGAGERLAIVDHDGGESHGYGFPPIPVTILDRATIATGGQLRLIVDADPWDSLISFEPGIPVELDGALELTFSDNVHLPTQVGRTLDLFDWTGVTPSGQFEIRSPYVWDLTNLYTTGEVTLIAVPEPSTAAVLMGVVMLAAPCRISSLRLRH
jgi:uncharacterized protein YjbI with pentapeptide repeats